MTFVEKDGTLHPTLTNSVLAIFVISVRLTSKAKSVGAPFRAVLHVNEYFLLKLLIAHSCWLC